MPHAGRHHQRWVDVRSDCTPPCVQIKTTDSGEMRNIVMFRRIVITGAVLAFPLGTGTVVATSVTPSGASVPFITANGSVTCTTLKGAVHYNPPLFYGGYVEYGDDDTQGEGSTASRPLAFNDGDQSSARRHPVRECDVVSHHHLDKQLGQPCAALARPFLRGRLCGTTRAAPASLWRKLTPTTVPFFDFATLTNDLQELGFDLPSDAGPRRRRPLLVRSPGCPRTPMSLQRRPPPPSSRSVRQRHPPA